MKTRISNGRWKTIYFAIVINILLLPPVYVWTKKKSEVMTVCTQKWYLSLFCLLNTNVGELHHYMYTSTLCARFYSFVDDLFIAFRCFLLFGKVVVSLTNSQFLFSILSSLGNIFPWPWQILIPRYQLIRI